jgi:hypothetical protein
MTYQQYSDTPITGYSESIINRIDNNSNSSNSDTSQYPTKFDLFVNKQNTSLGAFSVTETHTTSQIIGSTLYLDHRPAVDQTGGISAFTISNGGIIDTTQTDVISASIEFTTLPSSSTFTVTYSASADKVQDSHLNSLQNSVMSMQKVIGIGSPVGGNGTGLISLPMVSTVSPSSSAEYTSLKTLVPGLVMLNHLQDTLNIGSSNVAGIPDFGVGNTIAIGSTGASTRDTVIIDTNSLTIKAADASAAVFNIGTRTGEAVNISGVTTIASQTTIGLNGGALLDFEDSVPIGQAAFYSGAALRVHGGIWFGSGLSGNGNITLSATAGTVVTITGELDVENVEVSDYSIFNGIATFNDTVAVTSPGYLVTDNDIILQPKAGNAPSLIDGLDPSYAKWAIDNPGQPGEIVDSLRFPITTATNNPNPKVTKTHPVYGFAMYPIIAGWTYTGTIAYEKATVSGSRNIILINSNLSGIGSNSTTQGTSSILGGGSASSGDYCSGLFNPGDTFIEIKNVSDSDAYSYPVYYHQAFIDAGIATGLNLYVAADDTALQTSIAGKTYRLYQPGNAPVFHLSGWNGTISNPTCTYGVHSSIDYTYGTVNVITENGWAGGNNVTNRSVQHKKLQQASTIVVSVNDALSKSIDGLVGSSLAATGIAYIYVAGTSNSSTQETQIQIKASPTPVGIAAPNVQMGNPKILPGQHVAIGEIVASTNDGSTWRAQEVVSYRPKGLYDSCWIPLVEYSATNIPSYGRCLPFYSNANNYDITSNDDSGYYQFWVEHNLGPVTTRAEIEYHIYIANYGTQPFNLNPNLAGNGQNTSLKLSAKGSQNLWTPYANNYNSSHAYFTSQTYDRGFLKDLSAKFRLAYLDSRFAKFIWDSTTANISEFRGDGSRLAGYIRVIVKKIV